MDTSHVIDGGVGITVWSFLFAWTAFFVANVMQMDTSNVIDGGWWCWDHCSGHFCLDGLHSAFFVQVANKMQVLKVNKRPV
jgi:hypothetical protein